MFLIVDYSNKEITPIAYHQTAVVDKIISKDKDIITANYFIDHPNIISDFKKNYSWNWEHYDPIEEKNTEDNKKQVINYNKSFHSPIPGKSKIIVLGKQGRIKIARRDTSPTKDITTRYGVCIDDTLAKIFFNDCMKCDAYKDYGRYEIRYKDKELWAKWERIVKEQYENQYKLVYNNLYS